MMDSAQRYREFIADFEPHRAGLGEPQMVGIGGASSTDQARLEAMNLRWALSRSRRGSLIVSTLLVDLPGGSSCVESRARIVIGRL